MELANFIREERDREERMLKEKLSFEREERNKEREMKRLEIERNFEMEQSRMSSIQMSDNVVCEGVNAKLPKLPNFNEKCDNIEAYLKRFERFAESARWDKRHWSTNLSALLTGTALDVYSRMPVGEVTQYDKLKDNLLKSFHMTEEGFRVKFRSAKIENGETPSQFVVRLEGYLDNWRQQADVMRDFDGLSDLFLREQFMNSSSKSLQLFLKERKFKSVKEIAEAADRYVEAHESQVGNPSVNMRGQRHEHIVGAQAKSCFICNGNHLKRDCPSQRRQQAAVMVSRDRGQGNIGYGQRQFQRSGSKDKPWKQDRNMRCGEGKDRNDSNRKALSACCLSNKRSVVLQCGHEIPLMSAACNEPRNKMPVCIGRV